MTSLLMSFYGDDFTGSTDAMESLARAGVRTVLFTIPPVPEKLARYPGLRAFGIAGTTRTMTPEHMRPVLDRAFYRMNALQVPLVHYKVCSTFDSSPASGSIGVALDIGAAVLEAPVVPVVVGAPALGRYCVFGNLFARCGKESAPYRLDRHPSMSRHPITPMDEADLRVHLAKQTRKRIGLVDVTELANDPEAAMAARSREGAEVVLIDLVDEEQLAAVGKLIAGNRFVVGSSGVEMALAAHWKETGAISGKARFNAVEESGPMVALAGSQSPVTAAQIRHAVDQGFAEVELEPWLMEEGSEDVAPPAAHAAVSQLRRGRSVVVHTGQPWPRYGGGHAGDGLGEVLRLILEEASVRRVVVAGGDTSGEVAGAVRIEALEMVGELTRGAPLCRVSAPTTTADGIEIVFKGGQIGPVDFFDFVRRGHA